MIKTNGGFKKFGCYTGCRVASKGGSTHVGLPFAARSHRASVRAGSETNSVYKRSWRAKESRMLNQAGYRSCPILNSESERPESVVSGHGGNGPRIMVFGTPVLMMCLARPFPQEAGS